MRDIAILVFFCGMMVLAVRHVHLSVMLWIWTALAAPGAYLYGVGVDFPFNKAAAVVTAIALVADRMKRKFFLDGYFILFSLFMMQGLISFTFALTDMDRTYALLDKMLKIWLLTIIMKVACRDRLQLHAMVIMTTFALAVHGVLEGMKYLASAGGHKVEPSSFIGDNNYLALALLMALPLIAYLYHQLASQLLRLGLVGLGVAGFVGVVATASRGGLIGLVILGGLAFVQSKRKGLVSLAFVVVAAGLVVLAPARWTDRMETIQTAERDDSFMNRVVAWKMNTILALDRPFLGGGYSALEDGRVHRAYVPMFGMLDFIPTATPLGPLAAHSIYFSVLGDLGFIGLILFLSMIGATFFNIKKIKLISHGKPELAWAYSLANTFRACMIVYVIVGGALSAAYFEVLYIQLTLISMLRRSLEERAPHLASVPAAIASQPPDCWITAPPSRPWIR